MTRQDTCYCHLMMSLRFPLFQLLTCAFVIFISCSDGTSQSSKTGFQTGAERTELYLDRLQGLNIALVVNQSSQIGETHLVDSLISLGLQVKAILSPEHGFRGDADAGQKVKDAIDPETGIPLLSLYGKSKKPNPEQLEDIDLMIFDIQDVGARFYTYISTLHYVMQYCAEERLPLLVFDRPNPNGFYVDGPVLNPAFKSFVGMHPVPVVHGMTIGEYAQMINGEGWLEGYLKCDLDIIPIQGYEHSMPYDLPVDPSPNLKDSIAVYLYPSICFFEGTKVSLGRGTDRPFTMIGYPDNPINDFSFVPRPNKGSSKPRYMDQECTGLDLVSYGRQPFFEEHGLYLDWLIDAYQKSPKPDAFFEREDFFDLLAGSSSLREQIIAGKSSEEIKNSWKPALEAFKMTRKKYLIYPDFE